MSTVVSDDQARLNIAANINRLLASRGWNQQKLADATGENKMAISHIVRAHYIPNAAILARIAEALDVSIDRLLANPPENIPTKSVKAVDKR